MTKTFAAAFAVAMLVAPWAQAHYGMIIPSDNMIAQEDGRSVALSVSFSHPFEREGMELVAPVSFGVTTGEGEADLLDQLEPATIMDHPGFTLDHALERPGVYVFHMEPQPYWEPAEDAFIIHYTKTYVTAYGD
ncbi:MAG: DUF4198 domain-containing protein, partial [Geminicoccaceae bacterium]